MVLRLLGLLENSPAIYGWEARKPIFQVPSGTADDFLSSLTGLVIFPNREPSHKWLGYFQSRDFCNQLFAVNGVFDDDDCLVGMDYLGMPPVKS